MNRFVFGLVATLALAGPTVAQTTTVCVEEELAEAKSATADAKKAINTIMRYSNSGDAKTLDSIERWFGSSDDATRASIVETLSKVSAFIDAFDYRCIYSNDGSFVETVIEKETGKSVQVDSIGSTYAYVYPTGVFTVYLLRTFFESGNTGENSKLGTIVHEGSHFVLTGNTDDFVYGPNDALALAKQSPGDAVKNADNYQYFVEDWLFGI